MKKHPDAKIIKSLGGTAKVAELLGYKEYGSQIVNNWMTRGIPSKVKLEHPELFLNKKLVPVEQAA